MSCFKDQFKDKMIEAFCKLFNFAQYVFYKCFNKFALSFYSNIDAKKLLLGVVYNDVTVLGEGAKDFVTTALRP